MRFHGEQTRELTGHLSGRGPYENMLVWETAGQTWPDPRALEFARLWKAIPEVVFSTTLQKVEGNARLARRDVADEAAGLKNQPGAGIVSVGGAGLAACLAGRDLIDEYRLFVSPVVLGGGTSYFPPLPRKLDLELLETQTFAQVVYLRYRRG
jgi:dihydrofolate reductase